MNSLSNKRILLCVSGGIAAYKSADLVRRLQDAGADVRVVMTKAAREFITPLTMQALSSHPVHTELLDPEAEAGMGHIELGRWADAVVVAPATADVIARFAAGEAGDLLTAICLATPAPIVIAPAMNQGMWRKDSTRANIDLLRKRGFVVVGPAEGSQACGDVGPGRMMEPPAIIEGVAALFETGLLAGRKVVITAGPTREAIDPVRYISNHSSGKMGYALAVAAAEAGADTVLISGPTDLPAPDRVRIRRVVTAGEMLAACLEEVKNCQVFIGAAAVADYRPRQVAPQKIKKESETMAIELERNPDIISAVSDRPDRPFTVGFAAETQDVVANARGKLSRKKLDAVVANDVSRADIGFNSEHNQVYLVTADGVEELPFLAKGQLARVLIEKLAGRMTR